MLNRSQRHRTYELWKKILIPAIGGGLVFWATTIATSLLPIAAEYRAAYSDWSVQSVWIASLFVGLIIGCGVSYCLLGFYDRIPTKNPILKSVILGLIALVIVTILIDVPRSFLVPGQSDALYYFFVGVMFNATRFVLLGFVIGYVFNMQARSQLKGDKK